MDKERLLRTARALHSLLITGSRNLDWPEWDSMSEARQESWLDTAKWVLEVADGTPEKEN